MWGDTSYTTDAVNPRATRCRSGIVSRTSWKRFGDTDWFWALSLPVSKDRGEWGREGGCTWSSHVQRDPFRPCWEQLELTLASTVLGSSNSGSTVKSLHSNFLFSFFGAAARLYPAVPCFLAALALLKSILLESCLARSWRWSWAATGKRYVARRTTCRRKTSRIVSKVIESCQSRVLVLELWEIDINWTLRHFESFWRHVRLELRASLVVHEELFWAFPNWSFRRSHSQHLPEWNKKATKSFRKVWHLIPGRDRIWFPSR